MESATSEDCRCCHRRRRSPGGYATTLVIVASGLALAAIGLFLFAAVFNLWPAVDRGATPPTKALGVSLLLGAWELKVTLTTGLILTAILAGALGAYIHATTSFVTYVGNRDFKTSWLWWYVLRMFIGAALALLIYFAFRAGLLSAEASENVNPYGIAAISGLAGLFSKQATDKLEEVFDTFFRTGPRRGDAERKDKPDLPAEPPADAGDGARTDTDSAGS